MTSEPKLQASEEPSAPRMALVLFVGMLLGVALVGFLQKFMTPKPKEQVIRDVLQDQSRAWNSGNIEGFMEFYWRDEALEFRSGATLTRGFDATLARYKARYQSPGAEMGKLEFTDLVVTPVGSEAIVTGAWKLTREKDQPHGLFTLRFRQFDVGWRIVSDHTSSAEK
ncbi:MAG: YybH family protein [Fimbriiglobus sp.]